MSGRVGARTLTRRTWAWVSGRAVGGYLQGALSLLSRVDRILEVDGRLTLGDMNGALDLAFFGRSACSGQGGRRGALLA